MVEFKETIVGYDLEVGPNYFIIGLINLSDAMITKFEFYYNTSNFELRLTQHSGDPNRKQKDRYINYDFVFDTRNLTNDVDFRKHTGNFFKEFDKIKWLVSFNGFHYDDPVLEIFMLNIIDILIQQGYGNYDTVVKSITEAYNASVSIIEMGKKLKPNSQFKKESLDLKRISRTEKSLKMIAGSLKYPIVMDFPVNPHDHLSYQEVQGVSNYLNYDLEILYLLYQKLRPELNLRKNISLKYNTNVMNEDRPGIANDIFTKLYCKKSGLSLIDISKLKHKVVKTPRVLLKDVISSRVKFKSVEMQNFLNDISKVIVRCDGDKITMKVPDVTIGKSTYTIGAGGLHSQDNPGIFVSDSNFHYQDADVSSYYPRVIVTNKLYPIHLSPIFYELVEEIMNGRLEAKRTGDTVAADTLKIVVNSVFGKTGEEYSWFYSSEVFLGTTINGQLYLLMLIESLELQGFEVISANTDGIITKIPKGREPDYQAICNNWMVDTLMELEFSKYKLYARRSVNSYVAITDNGKIKTKDEFNSTNEIDKSAIAVVIPLMIIEFLKRKYVDNNPVSIRKLVADHLTEDNISDFMWTQKPADKDWHNVIYTANGPQEIPDTVRFLVCSNSYRHKVKLFKFKAPKSGDKYSKKISYIAKEYVAITNDFNESVYNNSVVPHVKLDYYIDKISEMISLIETGNVQSKLSLF